MVSNNHGAEKQKAMEFKNDIKLGAITIKAKGNDNYECIGWVLPGGTITSDRNHALWVLNNLLKRIKK